MTINSLPPCINLVQNPNFMQHKYYCLKALFENHSANIF